MTNLIEGVKDYLNNLKTVTEKKLETEIMPTIMQLNRLKQLISSRMCEIIHLLQGITKQFNQDFLPELPKNYSSKNEIRPMKNE